MHTNSTRFFAGDRTRALPGTWHCTRARPAAAVLPLCRRRLTLPVPIERPLQSFFDGESRGVTQLRDGRRRIRHRVPHVPGARRTVFGGHVDPLHFLQQFPDDDSACSGRHFRRCTCCPPQRARETPSCTAPLHLRRR